MSAELHADDWTAGPASTLRGVPTDRTRPNVSGDLPTVFQIAPMFRRTVAGYDRFQVDTYVQWAEDELATADREREHLLARHLRTTAALDEARELLAHSAGGGEFVHLSRRMGSMLAAAADEAAGIRADAEADRSAAADQAERLVADAERVLAEAETEAELLVVEAAADAAAMHADAVRIVEEAELTAAEVHVEADARLAKVREIERCAAERADQVRHQAAEQAAAILLNGRDEVVRLLGTGHEQRRRADAAAAATRQRLDDDATARRAALLAEVKKLERRRSTLRARVAELEARTAVPVERPLDLPLRRLLERTGWRSRRLRTP